MTSKNKKADATSTLIGDATTTIARQLDRARDLLAVGNIFSEPYQLGDVTIIAVARISGGAGGGGGEGTDDDQSGSGFGTGFGVQAKPVGVYRSATARSTGGQPSMSTRSSGVHRSSPEWRCCARRWRSYATDDDAHHGGENAARGDAIAEEDAVRFVVGAEVPSGSAAVPRCRRRSTR